MNPKIHVNMFKSIKKFYIIFTEFRLGICFNNPPTWEIGRAEHDMQTIYYIHMGYFSIDLSGYLR